MFNFLKIIIKNGMTSFISYLNMMHSHAPHNFQQPARICNRDPTLMPTYYEFDKNNCFQNL